MKKIIILFSVIFLLFIFYFYLRHPLGEKVIVRGHTIHVEVAVTESEKEKGLGNRDRLAADAGMLFVYQNRDRYGFWMKDMRFPLDFIWIDDNTIVDLSPNIPVPYTLAPKVPVNKVLEVNAGTIATLGLTIGDTVKFTN